MVVAAAGRGGGCWLLYFLCAICDANSHFLNHCDYCVMMIIIPSALLGVWNWSQTLLFFCSLENRDATQLMNDVIKFCFKNSHR